MNRILLLAILCLVSTCAFAERWTNVGSYEVVELGQKSSITIYGDSDSVSKTGVFATLSVKGFGSDPLSNSKVTFECAKEEIIWPNKKNVNIHRDYEEGSAVLSATVMMKLYGMACSKWFEIWK